MHQPLFRKTQHEYYKAYAKFEYAENAKHFVEFAATFYAGTQG
jgi:hypothetical protein